MLPGLWLLLTVPLAASAQQASQPPAAPTFTLPPVIVTAQKEPADAERLPVSVTAVSSEATRRRRLRHGQRRRRLLAEHARGRAVGAEDQQPVRPRHRVQPVESGHHDLHRRGAAAQLQLVEHRAAGRRADRVRARPAERALRPEHARRAGERDERPAVARRMDRPGGGAVRERRGARRARRASPALSPDPLAWGCRTDTASATASRSTTSPATRSTPGPRTSARPRCCGCRPRRGRPGSSSTASAPATATTR